MRIGIDFGGSKIEVAALAPDDSIRLRRRVPTPGFYNGAIAAVRDLVAWAEAGTGTRASVGAGVPGRIDPATGLVRSANCLDGHAVQRDFAMALGREVRVCGSPTTLPASR